MRGSHAGPWSLGRPRAQPGRPPAQTKRTQTWPAAATSAGAVTTPELLWPCRSACPLSTDRETAALAEKVIFSSNKRRGSNAPAKPQIPGGLELTLTEDTKSGVQSHQVATNLGGTDGNTQSHRQIRIRGGKILRGSAVLVPPARSVRLLAGPRRNPNSFASSTAEFHFQGLGGLLPYQGARGGKGCSRRASKRLGVWRSSPYSGGISEKGPSPPSSAARPRDPHRRRPGTW